MRYTDLVRRELEESGNYKDREIGRLRLYIECVKCAVRAISEEFYDELYGSKVKKLFALGTSLAGASLGAYIGSEHGHPASGAAIGYMVGLVGAPVLISSAKGFALMDEDEWGDPPG